MRGKSDASRGGGADASLPPFDGTPAAFDSLIEAVGPASLLVVIEGRMSRALRALHAPEDVFQEALLHAWRDRARLEWRGLKSFRSFLLSVIDNRIRDLNDLARARKRGGDGGGEDGVRLVRIEAPASTDDGRPRDGALFASTTPSRIAAYREERAAMQAALGVLPDELRDVVRLRLFEQLTLEEIASRLGIGEPAARQRFRKGAAIYRRKLEAALATRSGESAEKSGAPPAADSSPLL